MAPLTRARAWSVARWLLLLVGAVASTVAFAGLVIALDRASDPSPWLPIGILGLVTVVVALGAPTSGRATGH